MKWRFAAPAAAGVALAATSTAAASTIVYGCGNEVCAIDPATKAKRELARGGTAGRPNFSGHVSRDGRFFAWVNPYVVERASQIVRAL